MQKGQRAETRCPNPSGLKGLRRLPPASAVPGTVNPSRLICAPPIMDEGIDAPNKGGTGFAPIAKVTDQSRVARHGPAKDAGRHIRFPQESVDALDESGVKAGCGCAVADHTSPRRCITTQIRCLVSMSARASSTSVRASLLAMT
jgi:hypothetical protein